MPDAQAPPISASLDPIARSRFGVTEARRLLGRAAFGGTPDEIGGLVEMGPVAAVDHVLGFPVDPDDADAPARPGVIREPTDAERRAARRARSARDEEALAQIRTQRQAMQRADRRQLAELQAWWLTRMISTAHPAREKLVLFWHGHFATSYRGQQNAYHLLLQNRLFRRLALGPFDRLLRSVIRDPALLAYLNNNVSHRRKPNENLARELLELFTLGEGNYTERDIKDGARALTGYTFRGDEFVFREDWHDGDTKAILGVRGSLDGDGFVSAILRQRQCARHIAQRLYRFYVADIAESFDEAPPWARPVIDGMADRIRRARYDLRPALRDLFLSEHFYEPRLEGSRIKSPAELIVGAARSLGVRPERPAALVRLMARMGQHLFLPPSVAGWDGGRAWINTATLVLRQNAAAFLMAREDVRRALPAARDAEAFSAALLARLLGPVADPQTPTGRRARAALDQFFSAHEGRLTRRSALGAAALVTALPEFQQC